MPKVHWTPELREEVREETRSRKEVRKGSYVGPRALVILGVWRVG